MQQHGGCSTGGKCAPTHGIDSAFAAISTVGSSLWMRLRAATRKLAMKYHYLHSRFINWMIRVRQPLAPLCARPRGTSLASCLTASPLLVPSTVPGPRARVRPRCFLRRSFGTLLRWGVWLGGHTCYTTTQVPQSSAQAGRKPLTEEQVKGTADAVTFSKSPQCARVALRSFGQAREFQILKPEVSENLPQGKLACGSQAFEATLLFDPSMSALPSFSHATE